MKLNRLIPLLCLLAACAVVLLVLRFRSRRAGDQREGAALRVGLPVWLGVKGKQLGPFGPDEVKDMITRGEVVTTRDLIWQEGMERWVSLSEVFDPAKGGWQWRPGTEPHRGPSAAEVCERCAKAVEISPRDATAYRNWGLSLNRLGRRTEACEKYAKAVEIAPRDAEAYLGWGVALFELGQHADACGKFAKAVETNPRYARAYYNWGNALDELGRHAEACEKFAMAVKIDPRFAEAYTNWGVALHKLGRYADAREKHAKATEINPELAQAYVNWGIALAQVGKRAEAEEKWRKAIELKPELKPLIEVLREGPPGKE
ncbi:tetratricopeptide repeat protein [Planctomycetota bacterium]